MNYLNDFIVRNKFEIMKANRKAKYAREAVSATIGVILMVAITVSVAATVYVFTSGLIGGVKKLAPTVQFSKDEKNDRILIARTDGGVGWDDLAIRASHPITILINGEVTAGTGVSITDAYSSINASFLSSGVISDIFASDWIDIEGTFADLKDISITVVYRDTLSMLQIISFNDIPQRN